MHIGKPFFLISINKSAQQIKQTKLPNGLFLSPKYLDMKYNNQWGVILDIGTHAAAAFPGAKIGDILIFKHIIESQKWRVLEKKVNPETGVEDEHLLVDTRSGSEVYAVVTQEGEWIINNTYVFLHHQFTPITHEVISTSLLQMPDPNIYRDEERIMEQINTLKIDQENIKETAATQTDAYAFERQYAKMEEIAEEQAGLSKVLHASKYCKATVNKAHPDSEKAGIMPGRNVLVDSKILYDLKLESLGLAFKIAFTRHLVGIMA